MKKILKRGCYMVGTLALFAGVVGLGLAILVLDLYDTVRGRNDHQ